MKEFIIVMSVIFGFGLVLSLFQEPDITKPYNYALSGGLGFYKVNNYTIDKDKCINFIDDAKVKKRYCGNFKTQGYAEHERDQYGKSFIQ